MAFWGVEVKPTKPFTHKFDGLKGRLHISMATLGLGTANTRSILQCNVGNKSPVYLCSLYPGNSESLQLNLEFEEADEVIFSVIGPRSVHLSGYYLHSGKNGLNEESESYGEDIADTETERSACSDEDEYEDSFIDDAEPEVIPSSSDDEEESFSKRRKNKGGLQRLRRKFQITNSDDDGSPKQKVVVNGSTVDQIEDSDDEDCLPISSVCNNKATKKDLKEKLVRIDVEKPYESSYKAFADVTDNPKLNSKAENSLVHGQPNRETTVPHNPSVLGPEAAQKPKKQKNKGKEDGNLVQNDYLAVEESKLVENISPPLPEVGCDHDEKPKKKRKERIKKVVTVVASEDKVDDTEIKTCHSTNIQSQKSSNDKDCEIFNGLVSERSGRVKKKRKILEGKGHISTDDTSADNKIASLDDKARESIQKTDEKADNEKAIDSNARESHNDNQLEDREVKKTKKKKSKSQEGEETADKDMPQKGSLDMKPGNENGGNRPSHVKTLSNGLIIEKLELGKEDGKIAASGKKISIHYIGKVKDGKEFDSNIGSAPFKFRLGKREVIEGWDVGLEGMQVGEKRRLVIPPSMGFGIEGHGENIPPNSWLVYDIKLVKIH